jgi:putative methionine-R-sulfoxide reductase with GAF domain
MDEIRKNYKQLSPGEKRAFWITLLLGIIMAIFASQLFSDLIAPTTNLQTRLADAIPVVVSLTAFFTAGLYLNGKTVVGTWILYITTATSLLTAVFLAEGYGFPAASIILVIAVFLPTLIFQGRSISLVLLIGFALALLVIALDTFLPSTLNRIDIKPDDIRSANILTTIMVVIILAGIVFQYQRYPIRVKLIIAFIGLTALSVGVITTQYITITTRNLTKTIGLHVSREAQNKAVDLGNELNRIVNILIATSYDSGLQQSVKDRNQSYDQEHDIRNQVLEIDRQWQLFSASDQNNPLIYERLTNQATSAIKAISSRTPLIGNLFVIDAYGGLVATKQIDRQYDFFYESWWDKTHNSGFGAINISLRESSDTNGPFILINVPIIDREINQFIGVVGTEIPLEQFSTKFNADISLIGENAGFDIIFPGDPPKKFSYLSENIDPLIQGGDFLLKALVLAESQMYFQMNYEGKDSLVSIANVSDLHFSDYISSLKWQVAIYNPISDAFSPIETQRRASVAILLVIAPIGTAGALGLSQVLARPLQRLSEIAERFGSGDYGIRANIQTSDDEMNTLAKAFNNMADQTQSILAGLEKQVSDRTQAVITSAEVSRRLSTILDQQQLLISVVDEIQRAFGYYSVQIYLFDDEHENLLLMKGTGEAGKALLDRGHTIERGNGLVGRAAEMNSVIFITDTREEQNWLPIPLLPETKSELAIPITIGDHVMGVLDVQHNNSQDLSDQSAALLESIANQVAITLQNARLYKEAQQQADREAVILRISQKIQAETSIDRVLETAVRELGEALTLKRAVIQIESKYDNLTSIDKVSQ